MVPVKFHFGLESNADPGNEVTEKEAKMNKAKRSNAKGVLPIKVAAEAALYVGICATRFTADLDSVCSGHLGKMLALAPSASSMFWHLGLLREAGVPLHLDSDLDRYVHFCETGDVGQVCGDSGWAC